MGRYVLAPKRRGRKIVNEREMDALLDVLAHDALIAPHHENFESWTWENPLGLVSTLSLATGRALDNAV